MPPPQFFSACKKHVSSSPYPAHLRYTLCKGSKSSRGCQKEGTTHCTQAISTEHWQETNIWFRKRKLTIAKTGFLLHRRNRKVQNGRMLLNIYLCVFGFDLCFTPRVLTIKPVQPLTSIQSKLTKQPTWVRTKRTNPGLKIDMAEKSLKFSNTNLRLIEKEHKTFIYAADLPCVHSCTGDLKICCITQVSLCVSYIYSMLTFTYSIQFRIP